MDDVPILTRLAHQALSSLVIIMLAHGKDVSTSLALPRLDIYENAHTAECCHVRDDVRTCISRDDGRCLTTSSFAWTLKDSLVIRFVLRVESVKHMLVPTKRILTNAYELQSSTSSSS